MRAGLRSWLFAGSLMLSVAGPVFAQSPLEVALVVPAETPTTFWSKSVAFMQAVAEDLDIHLNVTYSKANDISLNRSTTAILKAAPKPDYFLTGRWAKVSHALLQQADARGIKTLTFNAGFSGDDRTEVGYPRGKLKHWIAELDSANSQAGAELIDTLVNRSKQLEIRQPNGKVGVIAVGAYLGDVVSEARLQGMKQQLQRRSDAELLDTILAGWRGETAREVMSKALERFPDAGVIWAASDEMLLGAIDAATQSNRLPGRDFAAGGFDWDPQVIDGITGDGITASMGGQIFDGGWALVLLYDYHHGLDFAGSVGTQITMPIHLLTAANATRYQRALNEADWRSIDFRRFSKKLNPAQKKYDFSLDAVVAALQAGGDE